MKAEIFFPDAAQLFSTVKMLREGKIDGPVKASSDEVLAQLRIPEIFTNTWIESATPMLKPMAMVAVILYYSASSIISGNDGSWGAYSIDFLRAFGLERSLSSCISSYDSVPKEQLLAQQVHGQFVSVLKDPNNSLTQHKLDRLLKDTSFFMSRYREKYSGASLTNALRMELAVLLLKGEAVMISSNALKAVFEKTAPPSTDAAEGGAPAETVSAAA